MNTLKTMLLALSLIGSTSFLVANEEEKNDEVVAVESPATEEATQEEQSSCECAN